MFKDRSRKPGENSAEFLKLGERSPEISSGAAEVAKERGAIVEAGLNNLRGVVNVGDVQPAQKTPGSESLNNARSINGPDTTDDLDPKLDALANEARRQIDEIPQEPYEIGKDNRQNPSTKNPETQATEDHVARISNIVKERYKK